MALVKKELDQWLDEVDYSYLNSSNYIPSEFSLKFLNFIKLVNGSQGESNKTPSFHLAMLDKLTSDKNRVLNLCFRGSGKALALYTPILTTNGWKTMETLQVGDTIFSECGFPTRVLYKSEIFYKKMYRILLEDGRSLDVSEDHINVILHRTAKRKPGEKKTYSVVERLEITTKDLLKYKVKSTRKPTKKNPSGYEHMMWIPNAEPLIYPIKKFLIDPYTLGIILGDGSIDHKVGAVRLTCHKDDLPHYLKAIPYKFGKESFDKRNPDVRYIGISKLGKAITKLNLKVSCGDKFIPEDYFTGSIGQRYELIRGLMDTDGTVSKGNHAVFTNKSQKLILGLQRLVHSVGGTTSLSEKIINGVTYYNLSVRTKRNPFLLERKAARYKATSAWINKTPIASITEIPVTPSQCIYVDHPSHTFLAGDMIVTHNTSIFMEYFTLFMAVIGEIPGMGDIDGFIYVADSIENGVKSARKNIEYRYERSDFLKKWIPKAKFTDNYLEFENTEGHKLGVKMFGATTGLRGTKIFGKRPKLALLDDLISDEDARSQTVMELIRSTIYSGVVHALDPNSNKIVFSGTPFHKEDVLVQAVESGGWDVNVYPVCEKFPCTKEEFRGAWEDRFSYEKVKQEYDFALANGVVNTFYQEKMLRLTSDDERLIQDSEIKWYSRMDLLNRKEYFNFYMTTDFATSTKNKADDTVISVWAYNCNGDWFWVDGYCDKVTMDQTVERIFRLVQEYHPQEVGVEVTGQQKGFVSILEKEMLRRNIFFVFARMKGSTEAGIRPAIDKLSRFNLVVPWFKMGKIYFPEEMKSSVIMGTFMKEIKLATRNGIKGHDDCIDTISMLAYMNPWKPAEAPKIIQSDDGIYSMEPEPEQLSAISSYIV